MYRRDVRHAVHSIGDSYAGPENQSILVTRGGPALVAEWHIRTLGPLITILQGSCISRVSGHCDNA